MILTILHIFLLLARADSTGDEHYRLKRCGDNPFRVLMIDAFASPEEALVASQQMIQNTSDPVLIAAYKDAALGIAQFRNSYGSNKDLFRAGSPPQPEGSGNHFSAGALKAIRARDTWEAINIFRENLINGADIDTAFSGAHKEIRGWAFGAGSGFNGAPELVRYHEMVKKIENGQWQTGTFPALEGDLVDAFGDVKTALKRITQGEDPATLISEYIQTGKKKATYGEAIRNSILSRAFLNDLQTRTGKINNIRPIVNAASRMGPDIALQFALSLEKHASSPEDNAALLRLMMREGEPSRPLTQTDAFVARLEKKGLLVSAVKVIGIVPDGEVRDSSLREVEERGGSFIGSFVHRAWLTKDIVEFLEVWQPRDVAGLERGWEWFQRLSGEHDLKRLMIERASGALAQVDLTQLNQDYLSKLIAVTIETSDFVNLETIVKNSSFQIVADSALEGAAFSLSRDPKMLRKFVEKMEEYVKAGLIRNSDLAQLKKIQKQTPGARKSFLSRIISAFKAACGR